MSLPSFSFVFLFHASISSSRRWRLLAALLALIYSFPLEMGFINHSNAALGKMVLSAGRDASPLRARQGEQLSAACWVPATGYRWHWGCAPARAPSGQGRRERSRGACSLPRPGEAGAGQRAARGSGGPPPRLGLAAQTPLLPPGAGSARPTRRLLLPSTPLPSTRLPARTPGPPRRGVGSRFLGRSGRLPTPPARVGSRVEHRRVCQALNRDMDTGPALPPPGASAAPLDPLPGCGSALGGFDCFLTSRPPSASVPPGAVGGPADPSSPTAFPTSSQRRLPGTALSALSILPVKATYYF